MRIINKAVAVTENNGEFDIQIEDWSEDYPNTFLPDNTLAAYPVSKVDTDSPFGPRRGSKFRCEFHFPNGKRAKEAFYALATANAELTDYLSYIWNLDYIPCVTGKEVS